MRILRLDHPQEIKDIMQEIRVDPYGISIMHPKAISHLVRINALSNITANILKQEMLSLGGDAAIARDSLTGRTKQTDCLLMGNLAQLRRLNQKLKVQPFGLGKLADNLSACLDNFHKEHFIFKVGSLALNLTDHTHIMGIVNVTPDSFSGDGLYQVRGRLSTVRQGTATRKIVDSAEQLVRDGADIIDLGGQSSRPGARPVSLKEELRRVIPVIKALGKRIKVPISIDTYKPEVARQALDNGALIVNDITGLRDKNLINVISRYKAGVVIMHMQGKPRTMQKKPHYLSVVDEVIAYLNEAVLRATAAGIPRERIIIDPGIGFGKTLAHNCQILKHLSDFKVLGLPILVGTSRKSFIGKILNRETGGRLFGTVSTCLLAAMQGAKIVRVHDVRQVKDALKTLDEVQGCL